MPVPQPVFGYWGVGWGWYDPLIPSIHTPMLVPMTKWDWAGLWSYPPGAGSAGHPTVDINTNQKLALLTKVEPGRPCGPASLHLPAARYK